MHILGIDQSLNASGICVLEDMRQVELLTIKPGDLRGLQRIGFIIDRITTLMDQYDPQIIVMEDYARSIQGSQALIPLVELGGVLKMAAYRRGYKFGIPGLMDGVKTFMVQNSSSMKKFMLANGSTSKDPAYLLTVFQKLNLQFVDDNQADAYMHAVMAGITSSIATQKAELSGLHWTQQEALIGPRIKKIKKMSIKKAMKLPEAEKFRLFTSAA